MPIKRNQPCPCGSGKRYKKCCAESDVCPETQSNKLSTYVLRKDFLDALKYFKNDQSLASYDPQDLFYLGTYFKNRSQIHEAISCFKEILSIDPDHPAANNDLGVIFQGQKKFNEAEFHFERTMAADPESPIAINNLGCLRRKQGRHHEALRLLREATRADPGYFMAFFNIGLLLRDEDEFDLALENLKQAVAIHKDYAQAYIEMAIIAWIKGELDFCRECLDLTSADSSFLTQNDKKTIIPFHKLISGLLDYEMENPDQYDGSAHLPLIYAIGDSHSLCLANRVLGGGDNKFSGKSLFVSGCKAWHLGNTELNEYKYTFEKKCSLIPSGAYVIVLIGEIDCRVDEGILVNHKKTNNDLDLSIRDVVENYVTYVDKILRSRKIVPVICNIPAPYVNRPGLIEDEKEEVCYVVEKFNEFLNEYAAMRKIRILDINSISKDKLGAAKPSAYIDNCHMKPSAYDELIAHVFD